MDSAFRYFDYMGKIVTEDSLTYELWECSECFCLVRHAAVVAHFTKHNIA